MAGNIQQKAGLEYITQFDVNKENRYLEDADRGWVRREFRTHSFSGSFSLDEAVNAGKIKAKYYDGVSHLTLPKRKLLEVFLVAIKCSR